MESKRRRSAKRQIQRESDKRYMVEREVVIKALRDARDGFLDAIKQEREEQGGGSNLYIQRGLIIAIETVKKVTGEWK